MSRSPDSTLSFSEKAFYLSEFRDRTLGMAVPQIAPHELAPMATVLGEFAANSTRVVLISSAPGSLSEIVRGPGVSASDRRWVGALWRGLRAEGVAVLHSEGSDLVELCGRVAGRLGLAKLVWVDESAVLRRSDGSRVPFLDLPELGALLARELEPAAADQAALLRGIHDMIEAGLPSVSVCGPEELAAELFTYAGSGTFFTRKRDPEVRPLVIDDFDAAQDLMGHGVREGYLVERTPSEVEEVLTHGFGVFIEGRYLAGIGALIPHESEGVGEIASLYTLTRFLGEGVGGHLVRFALKRARESGYRLVFACTTSERVERFFQRHGFESASPDSIPVEKWEGYPSERRSQVRCLTHPLGQ